MTSTTRASSPDRGAHHHGIRANAHNNRDRLLFEAADDRSIFVARGIPESSAGSVRPRWIRPGEVRLYESKMRERNFVASSFSVSLIRVNSGPVVVHARRCKTCAFLFAEPPLQNSSLMITSACLALKPRASTLSEKDRKIFSTVKLTLVRIALVWLGSLAMAPLVIAATPTPTGTSAVVPAVIEGRWIQPAEPNTTQLARQPLWGHADGLRVGLAHASHGPRGLLRIYAPYLGNPAEHVINYVAVEPIPKGQKHRGYSELEPSGLDGVRGKRFWSVADPADRTPRPAVKPVRGSITQIDGVEHLRVWIQVESFDNGAQVYVRVTFRADRPHEVALATFAHDDSTPLEHFILSATMGNYARLRNLQLANGEIASSLTLWPDHRGDGFTPHARFPLSQLIRTPKGHAVIVATSDEMDPAAAEYTPETREFWRYKGSVAKQSWRCEEPDPALQVLVNGRYVYWNSQSAIPGGVSFENFEMLSPFRQGEEFIFAVEPIISPKE